MREKRVRKKILSNSIRARLCVYRSLRFLYAQIIDDKKGKTLVAVNEKEITQAGAKKESKTQRAQKLGFLMSQKAKKHKITTVIFDRGQYRYHGRVAAFAKGAREGGLQF